MNRIILLVIIVATVAIGCSKDPMACFEMPEQALENQPVQLTNCSVNSDSFYWWVDNGDTFHQREPVIQFENRGKHLVYLTAYNKKGNKQSKFNRNITIGNLFIDSLVIRSVDTVDGMGNAWDMDGSGPDLQLVYGSDTSNAMIISREYPDFELADLPIVIEPVSDVELTDTTWHFQLIDKDVGDADTMTTWQLDPIQYDHEGPYNLQKGNFRLDLIYYFE